MQAMGTPIVTSPAISGETGPIPAASAVPEAPFDALMALLAPATPDAAVASGAPPSPVIDPTIAVSQAVAVPDLDAAKAATIPNVAAASSVLSSMVNAPSATPDSDLVDMLAMSALASRRVVARAPVPPQAAPQPAIAPEDFIGPMRPLVPPSEATVEAAPMADQAIAEDFIGPVLPTDRRREAAPQDLPSVLPTAVPDPDREIAAQEQLAAQLRDADSVEPASAPIQTAAPQLRSAEGLIQPTGDLPKPEQPSHEEMIALPKLIAAENGDVSTPKAVEAHVTPASVDNQDVAEIKPATVAARPFAQKERAAATMENIAPQNVKRADEVQFAQPTMALPSTTVHAAIDQEKIAVSTSDSTSDNDGQSDVLSLGATALPLSPQDAALLVAISNNQPHAHSVQRDAQQYADIPDARIQNADIQDADIRDARILEVHVGPTGVNQKIGSFEPRAPLNAQTGQQFADQQMFEQRAQQTAVQSAAAPLRDGSVAQMAQHGAAVKFMAQKGDHEIRAEANSEYTSDIDSEMAITPLNRDSAASRPVARNVEQHRANSSLDVLKRDQAETSTTAQNAMTTRVPEIDPKLAAMVHDISVTNGVDEHATAIAAQVTSLASVPTAEASTRDAPAISAIAADGRRDTQRDAEIRERQIKQQVTLALRAGSQEVRMQLYPPGLGQVMIRMVLDGQKLKLSMTADNTDATDALIYAEGGLRDALARDGFNLAGFDVHDDERKQKREQPHAQSISNPNSGNGDAFSVDMTA